jgi:hypothetical protein
LVLEVLEGKRDELAGVSSTVGGQTDIRVLVTASQGYDQGVSSL